MVSRKKLIQFGIFSKRHLRNIGPYLIVAIVLIWLAFTFIDGFSDLKNGEATLIIALDNGERRTFQGEVVDRMSILDALRASSQAGQINLEFKIDSGQTKIEKLNGYSADKDKKLAFYLNGSKTEEADIHNSMIGTSDTIEVKIE